MRITHLLTHYPEPSGTARAVQGQARGFARLGHEVEIWTKCGTSPAEDQAVGVRVCTYEKKDRWFPSAIAREAASGRKRDLVVIHGQFSPSMVAQAFALRRMKQAYIVCSHGIYHPAMLSRNRWKKVLFAPFERSALRGAAAVQLLAKSHAVHLENFGVRTRTVVVPNGFDLSSASTPPARRVAADGPARVLFLGRIDAWTKGLDLLLAAFLEVSRKTDVTLTLMGPPWRGLEALQRQAAQFRVPVEFPGPDYQRPPAEIISNYDLLVLPSRHEGFGLAALEAMVAKTPVVVSTETGISEYVRAAGAGWICEPSVAALAETLTDALGKRNEWAGMGERGRAYAIENLTWDAICTKAAADYQSLIPRP